MLIVVIIGFVILLILYSNINSSNKELRQKLGKLEKEFQLLNKKIQQIQNQTGQPIVSELVKTANIIKEKITDLKEKTKPESEIQPGSQETTLTVKEEVVSQNEVGITDHIKPSKVQPAIGSARVPTQKLSSVSQGNKRSLETKNKNEFWKKLEKQFIENWTGILGSVIMVAGVGFLGTYTAMSLSAVYRFLMITGLSVILFGGFLYLRQKEKWIQFGLWLRSSAAAIFLFACLASGGIEGLQWIDDPLFALGLLIVGIAVNLVLSWIGGNHIFASLHVLLSFVAMCFVPQGITTLIIAAVIALVGIILTYREKWDYHLLTTISLFFFYHIFWYLQIEDVKLSMATNITGLITVGLTSLTAAFVHYRDVYKTKTFETLPFIVHLLNWLYFAVGMSMHSTGSPYKTFAITAGATGLFFLARTAKKSGARWLYKTDTLLAHIVALFALVTLSAWGLSIQGICVLMLIESILFMLVMARENEETLFKTSSAIMNLVAIAILIYSGYTIINDNNTFSFTTVTWVGITLIVATAFHLYSIKQSTFPFDIIDYIIPPVNKDQKTGVSGIGAFIGFYFVILYVQLYHLNWIEYMALPIIGGYIILRDKLQSTSLIVSLLIMIGATFLLNWYSLFNHWDEGSSYIIRHGLPLLAIPILTLKWGYMELVNKKIKWFGIYLFSVHLFILAYFLLQPVSPLLFGVVALVASLIYFELANFIGLKFKEKLSAIGEPDRYLMHFGYYAILAFLLRHILVHLQVEDYIGFIKIRLAIELLAIAILVFISFIKKPVEKLNYTSWKIHPLLTELAIIFYTFTISLEVTAFWQPLVWVGTAFIFSIAGSKILQLLRFKLYALGFYLITAFQVAFLTSSYVTPSTHWMDQSWLTGLGAILCLFVFLVIQYKYLDLTVTQLPGILYRLSSLSVNIRNRKDIFYLYPLIFCVAIFFYWSFDKTLLTLLWVIECLTVFIISLIIRQQQFRYVALAALAVCIIRLIFFDLSQAGTLTKALVFLGVGVIMLFMNFLYKKYKDRFTDETVSDTTI